MSRPDNETINHRAPEARAWVRLFLPDCSVRHSTTCEKVLKRCGNHVLHIEVKDIVRSVNNVLRGWRAYYRCSNASRTFHGVQLYANHRMRRFLRRRKKKTGLGRYRDYTNEYLHKELGLVCILDQGSVRYSSR